MFSMVRKLGHQTKKLAKNFEICKERNCDGVSLKSNHFFAVHSNFTYDSEAYDLITLYLESSHSESG